MSFWRSLCKIVVVKPYEVLSFIVQSLEWNYQKAALQVHKCNAEAAIAMQSSPIQSSQVNRNNRRPEKLNAPFQRRMPALLFDSHNAIVDGSFPQNPHDARVFLTQDGFATRIIACQSDV